MRDEHYVINLCDEVLQIKASRQHTFDFLRGDGNPGRKLPVDAYYPSLNLAIEYRERQHTEPVQFWDRKPTVSGMPRGQQRALYDQRRREVLPKNGSEFIELSFSDFTHDSARRLRRERGPDLEVISRKLSKWVDATSG